MNYDVVGLGQCCIDYLGVVGQYPDINEKSEISDLTVQGGGPVAVSILVRRHCRGLFTKANLSFDV